MKNKENSNLRGFSTGMDSWSQMKLMRELWNEEVSEGVTTRPKREMPKL